MQPKIDNIINDAISQHFFPGAVLGYIINDQHHIKAYGNFTYSPTSTKVQTSTIYDLASVTKFIPTACLILYLIEQGKLSLDTKIVKFIPEFKHGKDVTIKHLLTYTAILDLPRLSTLWTTGGHKLLQACLSSKLTNKAGQEFLYTNFPPTLLAMAAERICDKKFEDLAAEIFFKPMGMQSATFHPKIAPPTEINQRGEVAAKCHDESAWALIKDGLSCGHAGLFANANDLLFFAQMLLNGGNYEGKKYLSNATIKQIYKNQIGKLGKVGLGCFINKGPFGFFGEKASLESFGMTGFCGTSITIDPQKQRAVVLLSNATYPKRKDDKSIIDNVRKQLNDIVFG